MKQFFSFSEFLSFGQACYQNLSDTCQQLFDTYSLSATDSEITEICETPLNIFNQVTENLYETANDGENSFEDRLNRASENEISDDEAQPLARLVQNSYLSGQITNAFSSANYIVPAARIATAYCSTTACQNAAFDLENQAIQQCNGYPDFGTGDFTNGAASLSGNTALLFVGAYAAGQALHTLCDYWTKSEKPIVDSHEKLSVKTKIN